MRIRTSLAIVVSLLATTLFLLSPARAAAPGKTALVIGNSNYPGMPLANPVHDATDIGKELTELGFRVTLVTNGTRRQMENAVRDLSKRLADGGVGLFYFAGHGVQVNGENYLIPVDADIETEADVRYEAVSAGRILDHLKLAGNQMNIIILDACRNNPFARSMRSETSGLARMDAPTGSIMAYATAPGSVAADGQGRNGVYTENLLKAMRTPGLDIYDTFMQVRRGVIKETQGRQTPWESSSLIGKFYFREKEPEPVAAPVPDPQTEALKAQLVAMQQQMATLQEQARQNAQMVQTRKTDQANEELKAQLLAMQQQMAAMREESERKKAEPVTVAQPDQSSEELKAQLLAMQQQVASLEQHRIAVPSGSSFLRTDVDPASARIKARSEAKGRLMFSLVPMAYYWPTSHGANTVFGPKVEEQLPAILSQRDDALPVFAPQGSSGALYSYTLDNSVGASLWPQGPTGPPDTRTLKRIAKKLHADILVALSLVKPYHKAFVNLEYYTYDVKKDALTSYRTTEIIPDFYKMNNLQMFVQRAVNNAMDEYLGKKSGWW